MVDMICLELALEFVLCDTGCCRHTSARGPSRGIASKTVNGSFPPPSLAALAVWFLYWPPTSTVGSRPNNTPKTLSDQREHDPETLWSR